MRHILDEITILEMTQEQAIEIFRDFIYDSTRFLEILEAGGRVSSAYDARIEITEQAINKLREIWDESD